MDNLLLEKILSGLSVMSGVCEHGKACAMRDRVSKESSHDFVGDRVRQVLEEQVASFDPFNRERQKNHKYREKPRGSPYMGTRETELDRYLKRMMGISVFRIKNCSKIINV